MTKYAASFVVMCTILATLYCSAQAYISCSGCDGSYVNSRLGSGCVAAVREKCGGLRNRATGTWVRGVRVKDNCASIPQYTAIATFHGPGTTYNSGRYKHAGIFMGNCNANGFDIFDQWVGRDGCKLRRLPFGTSGVNGGDNFWTIN